MTVPYPLPTPPVRPDGPAPPGLTRGSLRDDPLVDGPRRGRARRWLYAAVGQGELALGAAVVDLGLVGTAFVWVAVDGGVRTWERRTVPGRGLGVGDLPHQGAGWTSRGARVAIHGDGGLRLDVPLGEGRLAAEITAGPATPIVLVTRTPAGGWNATEKAAGYPTAGWLDVDGRRRRVTGGGWRDWTAGRQDRHTVWRWAAGAGRDGRGRHVGLNVSTGMNAQGEGEDVVWWDGVPHRLTVDELEPTGPDPAGPWRVAGSGWDLRLRPWGSRAADEDLWVLRSRYVQPVGVLVGSLPGPDGRPVEVELVGVTEDHAATW